MKTINESYIKNVMSQLMNTEPEEFEPLTVNVPTMADDGAEVAILMTGIAKGGKLINVMATEFDVMESQKTGLKNMLSGKDEQSSKDDKEEEYK